MLTLKSDLKPTSGRHDPARLAFSPDGTALLVSTGDEVQVWPRWLDAPPLPVATSESSLERVAFTPDGSRVYLYRSGNSYTDVLDVASGTVTESGLPKEDPSWFHFDANGGFALVCRGQGNLVRFDYTPRLKKPFREVWAIDRQTDGPEERRKPLGSHYRFGAICGPAGVFVALEYKFGGSEPFWGLTVRSVADGSIVFHRPMKSTAASSLLNDAGLTLAVHPSGRYLAYPDGPAIRLRALAADVKVRNKLPRPPAPKPVAKRKPAQKAAKKKTPPACSAVAFNPSGTLLAAVGDDSLVTLYDTDSWKVVRSFAWKIGKLRAVCFSADGTRAAVWSEKGTVMVWDMDV